MNDDTATTKRDVAEHDVTPEVETAIRDLADVLDLWTIRLGRDH